ncbi:ankyrin repeat-containing domain protein [Aspergillus novoparasiticus]|uniref:Ankyrin repeat-containing domain protein n=1 Tax=Aspergillus novoparasiticus TaxID=986946 RepID=A0A5N6E9D1_9EURO|nr:ankyrin repeat-containing domain protein [Aspergillus novoparasiticus]
MQQVALRAAAQGGHIDIAKLLLDKGADVNAAAYDGMTALQAASRGGNFVLINLLLERGAKA